MSKLIEGKRNKYDQVKSLIIKQSQQWGGGQWFSNGRARKEIVNTVDKLTESTLNLYILQLKNEGFLSQIDGEGRAWYKIDITK